MKLLELDDDILKIPNAVYDTCFSMSASTFARITRNLAQFNRTVGVTVCDAGVYFNIKDTALCASVFLQDVVETSFNGTRAIEGDEDESLIDIGNLSVEGESTKRKSAVSL